MSESRYAGELPECASRRNLLRAAGGVALLLGASPWLSAKELSADPRKRPPQTGDELVRVNDDGEAELIAAKIVPLHAPPRMVYPRDPATQVVRDRSRLNQILLLRFETQELSVETRAHSVDGIVAYSGICTHAACSVTEWDAQALRLICPCHASQYDPREQARRIAGPAPRALPALPLKQRDGKLIVAAVFIGPVGAAKA